MLIEPVKLVLRLVKVQECILHHFADSREWDEALFFAHVDVFELCLHTIVGDELVESFLVQQLKFDGINEIVCDGIRSDNDRLLGLDRCRLVLLRSLFINLVRDGSRRLHLYSSVLNGISL